MIGEWMKTIQIIQTIIVRKRVVVQGTEEEESTTIGAILAVEMGMGMTIKAIKSYAC